MAGLTNFVVAKMTSLILIWKNLQNFILSNKNKQ